MCSEVSSSLNCLLLDRFGAAKACWCVGNAYTEMEQHTEAYIFTCKHLELAMQVSVLCVGMCVCVCEVMEAHHTTPLNPPLSVTFHHHFNHASVTHAMRDTTLQLSLRSPINASPYISFGVTLIINK